MAPQKDEKLIELEPNFTLWRLLDHTRFMIARLREKELDQFGLTPEQTHILFILAHHDGPASINYIVEITQRQHHSISTQIDRMTKQGLVNRKRSAEDARRYEVAITKRGLALLNKVTRDSVEQTFSCLAEEDKAALRKSLKCLLARAYNLNSKVYQTHWGE
ncbi:MAG TPA: MarR family transcriptional regulator [Dehalococcoidales bacterium]|nr:MarR family transcriptional regulator [Dehalococcoidales bacterium]